MRLRQTSSLTKTQKFQIIELWNTEFPEKIAQSSLNDFEKYLEALFDRHHIILYDEHNAIKGWLCHFIRDGERWFAMLLDASAQGKGYGSRLLDLAKENNVRLNGWVVDRDTELKNNGEYYRSPIEFYRKNEFEILTDQKFDYQGIQGIRVRWEK